MILLLSGFQELRDVIKNAKVMQDYVVIDVRDDDYDVGVGSPYSGHQKLTTWTNLFTIFPRAAISQAA